VAFGLIPKDMQVFLSPGENYDTTYYCFAVPGLYKLPNVELTMDGMKVRNIRNPLIQLSICSTSSSNRKGKRQIPIIPFSGPNHPSI